MKNKLFIILSFTVGFASAWGLYGLTHRNNSYTKVTNLRNAYIDSFHYAIDNYCLALSCDKESDNWKACKSMQSICRQFDYIGNEIQLCHCIPQLRNNLMDSISFFLSIIEKQQYKGVVEDALSAISDDESDINENMHLLYAVENFLTYQYVAYNCRHSIGISYAELLNYPQKNTIKLGETYSTQLVFSVTDVIGNSNLLEIDTGNIAKQLVLNEMRFSQKPSTAGHYHHDLILMVPSLFSEKGWTTSVDYDVR